MAIHADLWVFGYGSLIYDPGVEVAETRPATLQDYRRRFCMWSIHHRGSEADPGLVLALEAHQGGRCDGVALRPSDPEKALIELRERELISSAYTEEELTLETQAGPVTALGYVMNPRHRQYAPDLTLEQQAQVIAHASGGRGPNCDYLFHSVAAMRALEIEDPDLDWLVARVQQIIGGR